MCDCLEYTDEGYGPSMYLCECCTELKILHEAKLKEAERLLKAVLDNIDHITAPLEAEISEFVYPEIQDAF